MIALRAGAVEETISSAGILLDNTDAIVVAMSVNEIVENNELRNEIINKGLIRAQIFHPENTLKSYVDYLAQWY